MLLDDPQTRGGATAAPSQQGSAAGAFGSAFTQGLESTSLGMLNRSVEASGYDDAAQMTEVQYKASPFFRDGQYETGMTVSQAKVKAAKYDAEVASLKQAGHPIASFFGGLAGGALDPLFYIPYMDVVAPALKAAEIAKRGEILGEAITQSANAMTAALAEQPLAYATAKQTGQDYDIEDAATMTTYALLGGGFFGGLGAKMRLALPQKVAGIQKTLDDIHMGRQVDTAPVVNPVASMDDAVRRALQDGQIPPLSKDMSPEAQRAIQVQEKVSRGTLLEGNLGDDAKFLESFKNDGGTSYYKSKISELGDRTDVETRKRVDQMTPEEKTQALLTDELTGIPNRRAFQESERMPVQVATDLDNFKLVNDTMTHEGGDKVLKNVAGVMKEEFEKQGGRVFRLGGDEFHGEAPTKESAAAAMKNVRSRLDRAIIDVELPDGTKLTKKGMGVSYGTGADRIEAEVGLKADKAAREAAGLRTARTADIERVAPDATQGNQGDAGSRAAKLAYYKERLAAVTHSEPDWSPTGPKAEVRPPPDLSGLPLTDADKAELATAEAEATKLEDMAKALKVGASCFGIK